MGALRGPVDDLDQRGRIMAEYVWLGGAETTGGFDIRGKTKTLDFVPKSPDELPIWNYDGSSTGQAPGENSEVLIKPVAIFPDPFRRDPNILVLCEAGINAEVMPGQWEYQIGPCTGIESGDHMWVSRYLMFRVCELLGCNVTFDPKPATGDWNGAGCHTNYSTKAMRAAGGYDVIIKAVEKLGTKHDEHIKVYGEGNERRLTGAHETAPITKFSYGVANRGASVRIPRDAEANKCGYFEDRRPASNMDPYVVTAKIFDTTCL